MKNVLMLAVSAMTIQAASANCGGSSLTSGFYTGINAAYAYNTAQAMNPGTQQVGPKAKVSSFLGSLAAGYQHVFTNNFLLDLYLAGSYNTAKAVLLDADLVDGANNPTGHLKITYKPRFGIGAGIRLGYVMGKIAPFIGARAQYDWGQASMVNTVTATNTTESASVSASALSIVPEVGMKIALNEKWSALLSVGYQIGLSIKRSENWKSKPSAWVVQAGVQYTF